MLVRLLASVALFSIAPRFVQAQHDSVHVKTLNLITVRSYADGKSTLADVSGVNIFAGKKTDALLLHGGEANLPQNVGRMIFAKIPGINIWDMDGAGVQMNIGTRGTDAHRSIEMNMRQNGYNTNSDMSGYPENHYTVPMQGVRQVQLVRGSAALQFGSQFGGMMNYVMKEGDSSKVFSVESEQTYGSYNFFNSYNAVGGKKGKVTYYAYFDERRGDGWRPNSGFQYKAYYANLTYQFSKNGSLSLQYSRTGYQQQIAGGLMDVQFQKNARDSNRARNYFSPKINIPALVLKYGLSSSTKLQFTTNAVWGERSSVQFINTPNVRDTINSLTGAYNPRQVDRDFYKGITMELRLMHDYHIAKIRGTLAAGLRYFNEQTKRRQKGIGTVNSNFDLSIASGYGIDLLFRTANYAGFVENIFQLTKQLSFTPGFRYEVISSSLGGSINAGALPVSYSGKRSFPLFGAGIQYQVNRLTQVYANLSQAYRPYLYANITPADQIGVIDPNLKDSKGYGIDAGYRGHVLNIVNFDVNVFYLFYGNRIGKLSETGNNSSYLFTTNIGNSIAKGAEVYANISLWRLFNRSRTTTDLRLYNSLAYTHARYANAVVSNGSDNVSLSGNHVEGVPDWINRAGIEFQRLGVYTRLQMSYTSKQFNDANNTINNATGIVGVVPSYMLWDWAVDWSFTKWCRVSGGINNIGNLKYFSRRINMYPGPGILPGDPRTFYVSLGVKL